MTDLLELLESFDPQTWLDVVMGISGLLILTGMSVLDTRKPGP